ncbi:sugar nucleotide-binding protein [Asanoa sp. WMMD1127]|uniref:sugar nucleotide-binding protein n=1 Tax=Asanoa sp. WMMD1127 TaxID=3016107 RepID=UPI002415C9F4|nr:sugar nucleotide-binding protein [Asanoa sp. WMMD1127]MDG4826418.1 sugar nucleotide-binding protein [Asanoa sp. WMMD1127]
MDLLVVGGTGLLGREVTQQALAKGLDVAATFYSGTPTTAAARWRRLDIRRRDEVMALVDELRPRAVVNAAYQQADWVTTADGGTHVALAAAAAGARLVHVSSDAVFSGDAERYDERATPDPTTPYGAAKAAAETAVKAIVPGAVIARTSLIIGYGDSQHERHVHALTTGAATGALFTDDIRCPVHVADLAAALLELSDAGSHGIQHVGGAEAVSRHELGVLIARRDGLDPGRLPAALRAAAGIPGPVAVRLDGAATRARLGTRLRGAREFLS